MILVSKSVVSTMKVLHPFQSPDHICPRYTRLVIKPMQNKTHQTFKVLPFELFLTYLHVTPVRRRCEARKNTNIQSDLEPSSKWQNHQANPVFPRSVIKRGQVLENTTKPSFLSLHELPDPCCGLATVPILGSFNRTRLNCHTSSSVQCPHIEKLPSPPRAPTMGCLLCATRE